MALKKVYKVSFKGVILPGFDKEQVIENVHEITRIPKQTIIRKFFSGKIVVIRHADSQEYATNLQKKFAHAGIETYINEVNETVTEEEPLNSKTPTEPKLQSNSNSQDQLNKKANKSNSLKFITAAAFVIILSITFMFFMNDEPNVKQDSTQAKASKTLVHDSSPGTDGSDESKVTVENTGKNSLQLSQGKSKNSIPFFINKDEVDVLLKVSDKSELKQLSQFMLLLGLESNVIEIIKEEINTNTLIDISSEHPIYLVRSNIKNKDGNIIDVSILLKTSKTISPVNLSKLKKKLDTNDKLLKSCKKEINITAIINNNYLLLTSTTDKNKINNFNKLSESNLLKTHFIQSDQFFQDNKNHISFNLFYRHVKDKIIQSLLFSSSNELFWLSSKQDLNKRNRDLLSQLQINTSKENIRTSIKTKKLSDIILLLIAQEYIENNFALPLKKSTFVQEKVSKIQKKYSVEDIIPYQKDLDLELFAQWTSGPFAISTNQFKFDNNLVIELLAKGQNLQNLMEYSQASHIRVNHVLNNSNVNIIEQDCKKKAEPQTSIPENYFKDLDGEQEAYINDDFLKYFTVTAKKSVNIKSGYSNSDIKKIEGEIILELPEKIQQKNLDSNQNGQYIQLKDFSIFISKRPQSNILEYSVAGNTKKFITLRAYNYAGEVIKTLSFEQDSHIGNSIKNYRQKFSESIAAIKVFYTEQNNTIKYPFAFKPEIILNSYSNLVEEEEPLIEENKLISFDGSNLGSKALKAGVQMDNPDWLGKMWPNNKTYESATLPFYVKLFIHEDSKTTANQVTLDSVLNIKTNLSPFITQNITAVKLTLLEQDKKLFDNFISFNINELVEGEPDLEQSGNITQPQIIPYLNSNSAFEIDIKSLQKGKPNKLHGHITFNLPSSFRTHSKKYAALGQIIKLDGLFVKTIQLDKHQIQFEIRGELKNLVQLKLYNKNKKLISEPFEFKHSENEKAILSLLYNGEIETIKLALSQKSIVKEFPFTFSD